MRRVPTLVGALFWLLSASWAASASAVGWPEEASRIEARLGSQEPAVRRAAARELQRLSPVLARPLVLRSLEDPDLEVRLAAARAAISLRFSDLGGKVTGLLHEREVQLRLVAVELLLLGPTEAAIEPLGRVLADADVRVRRGAASALGAMGSLESTTGSTDAAARAAAQLLGRLDDREPSVRAAVIDSLARLGDPKAVLPLVSKIQDDEVEVRIAVVRALGVLGDKRASSALLLAARDRDPDVVAQAVRALGLIGDSGSVPSLIALSQEPNSLHARRAALTALGVLSVRLGPQQGAAVERAVQALNEPGLSAIAQQVLVRVGRRAAQPLQRCMTRAVGSASAACAETLVAVAPEISVEPIQRALQQGSVSAAAAVEALGGTGSAEGLIVALEHLTHPDPEARRSALKAVRRLLRARQGEGWAAGPVLAALPSGAWSRAERAELIEVLGWSRDAAVGATLAAAANSSERRLKLAALAALGRVPNHGQDRVLLDALDDADAEVRRTAALSLRSQGSAESAAELLARLTVREGQDRQAVALAIRGPLRAGNAREHAVRAFELMDGLAGPARDSLIEAVVASAAPDTLQKLLTRSSPADRAKLAEALGSRPQSQAFLRHLAVDPNPAVRANAFWSLGDFPPEPADEKLARAALSDADAAVAAQGAAIVARWVVQGHLAEANAREKWSAPLCASLSDGRPLVRMNAAIGLFRMKHECEGRSWANMLQSDPAELVRGAVAHQLGAPAVGEGERAEAARLALRRCAAFERSLSVARQCNHALGLPNAGNEAIVAGEPERGSASLAFVVGRRDALPLPRHPYVALQQTSELEVGLGRAGWTDRRGAFEVPAGASVRLLEGSLLRRRFP